MSSVTVIKWTFWTTKNWDKNNKGNDPELNLCTAFSKQRDKKISLYWIILFSVEETLDAFRVHKYK